MHVMHCISKFKAHNWFKFYAAVRVLFCFIFSYISLVKFIKSLYSVIKAQNEAKREEKKRKKKKRENWGEVKIN